MAEQNDNSCAYPAVTIDEKGGIIKQSNISINIPASALDIPVDITVGQVSRAPKLEGVKGSVLKLGPPGTQFKNPITICIDQSPDDDTTGLGLFISSNGEIWEITNNT